MKALQRPLFLITLLLAGVATSLAADGDLHTLKLVDVGSGYVMGGVYTSPYGVTVDGVRELMICDDFKFDIPTIPYTWAATETSLTDILNSPPAPGTPKFAGPNMELNYTTAAILAGQLLSLPNLYSSQAGVLSYAIWAIFDPSVLNTIQNGSYYTGHGYLTTDQRETANNLLKDAKDKAALALANKDFSAIPQLTIYTPATGVSPYKDSQEFLRVRITVPEPSFIALLAVDLMGIAGLVLFVRRRRARAIN